MILCETKQLGTQHRTEIMGGYDKTFNLIYDETQVQQHLNPK